MRDTYMNKGKIFDQRYSIRDTLKTYTSTKNGKRQKTIEKLHVLFQQYFRFILLTNRILRIGQCNYYFDTLLQLKVDLSK